jgi:hypothetical protein
LTLSKLCFQEVTLAKLNTPASELKPDEISFSPVASRSDPVRDKEARSEIGKLRSICFNLLGSRGNI